MVRGPSPARGAPPHDAPERPLDEDAPEWPVDERERARRVAGRLRDAEVPDPDTDARLLVRHASPEGLAELVARREAREPLQLILGAVGFRYSDLEVRPGVFIPRPETEVLAGEAIERVGEGAVVVEPCTGSGAVAIAVATESPAGAVHATDSSPHAVDLARRNAAAVGAEISVREGDLLSPLPSALLGRVDVLVANPPYVATAEVAGLEPEVADWDPRDALVSGPTGHEVTDRLIAQGRRWLAPEGWLLLEVAAPRAEATARRAEAAGYEAVGVIEDLTGRERIVRARLRR